MEDNSTLERLNGQINALIAAVQEAREENARLADELSACQAITRQREETVNDLEESVGLKDLELEDLAMRIEGVLGTAAPADSSAASDSGTDSAAGSAAKVDANSAAGTGSSAETTTRTEAAMA